MGDNKDAMAKGQNAHQDGSTGGKYGTFLILSVSAQKHTGWGGGNDRNGDPAINIIIGEPKKKERTVVNRAGWGVKEGRPEGGDMTQPGG